MGILFGAVLAFGLAAADLPAFDFTIPGGAQGWQPTHDIASLEPGPEGLVATIAGRDPYFIGPLRDYPVGVALWMTIRLKSDAGGTAQVFYFTSGATEENSVRFQVPAGQWHEARVRMVPLGTGYRLRVDPPGSEGTCTVASIVFEERAIWSAPAWPVPTPPELGADALELTAGDLRIEHDARTLGAFQVTVGGRRMAVGHPRAMLGWAAGTELRWLPFGNDPANPVRVERHSESLVALGEWRDDAGGRWEVRQTFTSGGPGVIHVESRVTVSEDRAVVYLPMFTLLPGLGSFGTNKHQALFAGIEYLENEPSSSEADLTGPAAQRQVPDTRKITLPLMALEANGAYVGLIWEMAPRFCAVFDSPDRQFGSDGHLMGILFPGSDGANRDENRLLPYAGESLAAGEPVVLRATLIGGAGNSVVPAIRRYVQLRGLPPVPAPGYAAGEYYILAAHGWLDSRIREGNLYRHAYWPGFNAQPAADAALWMRWLSQRVADAAFEQRLTNAAAMAIGQVTVEHYNSSQIGHVHDPAPALTFGAVPENAAQARRQALALARRFEPDGSVLYQAPAGGTDYGKTHFAPDANGLTAGVVLRMLEAAAVAGDPALIDQGLGYLRAMDKFRHTVPRGAQTWEIPLHAPDILASAYLVRAYVLGFELSGDRDWLEQAIDWAWTGVPFLYLHPPTSGEVGVYATIPVLAATGWVAPVWIGLPVQWCGLVYADALWRLARHDRTGPWEQIARGIGASGIQQTWPVADAERQGLLPDVFHLASQQRDGPAINPATVQAVALRVYGDAGPYDFRAFLRHGLLVHAPGPMRDVVEGTEGISFRVEPAVASAAWLLVNGFNVSSGVRLNGRESTIVAPHQYHSNEKRLVLRLEGETMVELLQTATVAVRIQRADAPPGVRLSWPLAAVGCQLESTATALGGVVDWQRVRAAPIEREGQWSVWLEAIGGQGYFRLRRALWEP